MDGFAALRSGKQQLQDELLASYNRMTDPDEMEKAQIENGREAFAQDTEADAGL
jgi:hypothetical protein